MIVLGLFAVLAGMMIGSSSSMNLKKSERWRQSPNLWTNLAAGGLCCALTRGLVGNQLSNWLSLLPPSWSTQIGQSWAYALATNLLSGLAMLLTKSVVRPFLKQAAPHGWVSKFYHKKGDSDVIQPTADTSHMRKWARTALGMTGLALGAGAALNHFLPQFFPATAFQWWPMLLVGSELEALWFAEGQGEPEPAPDDRDHPEPKQDEEDYARTFPEWFVHQSAVYDDSQAESRTMPPRDQLIAGCMEKIVTNKHILIDGVLFSGLGEALVVYWVRRAGRGEKVLFLAMDNREAEKSASFIRRFADPAHNAGQTVRIRTAADIQQIEDYDIAVLTPQQVLELKPGTVDESYLNQLKHLVVLDTTRLLSWQSDLIMTVIRLLMNRTPLQKTYFMCTSIPLQLSTVIQRLIGVSEVCIVGSELNERPHTVYLWRKENQINKDLPLMKLTQVSVQAHEFDLTAPLAVKAYRLGRVPIRVISERFPVRQIAQAIRIAANIFNTIVPVEQLLHELRDDEDQSFTVLFEDEECHLSAALAHAQKYTTDNGNVHLISHPYLLRDYFAARFQRDPVAFLRERTYANALSASFMDSAYTVAVQIMIEAGSEGGITEKRLKKLTAEYLPGGSLKEILCWCGQLIFQRPDYNDPESDFWIRTDEVFTDEGQFVPERKVFSNNPKALDDLQHSKLKRAMLKIPGAEKPIPLRFSADSIRQRLLKQQSFLYDGIVYQIIEIDDARGIITADIAPEDMKTSTDFVQTRFYDLTRGASRPVGSMIKQPNRIIVQHYVSDAIQVTTPGYYILPPDFTAPKLLVPNAMRYQVLESPERRELKDAHFTVMGLSCPQNADRAAVTLAVLLNELFRTYFPSDWPCIAACPVLTGSADQDLQTVWTALSSYYPATNAALHQDVFQPGFAYVAIIEDCTHTDGRLIKALTGSEQRPFEMPLTVLKDYLTWLDGEEKDRSSYLCFGESSIHPCLDIKLVTEMLNQVLFDG